MSEADPSETGSTDYAPRKKRHKLERNEITLNLVAMLDMSFNILIFFILTANFAVGEGILTAKMPKGGSGEAAMPDKPPEVPLNIIISSTGTSNYPSIKIEGDTAPLGNFTDLTNRLVQLQKNPDKGRNGIYMPDNPIVIKNDPSVRWNYVVCTFNAAVSAQYSSVSFASVAPEQ